MAKSWEIDSGARAHIVLGQLLKDNPRYHQAWTAKTVEKLVEFGLAELADIPPSWGWGKSKQVVITSAGKEAFHVAQNNGFVRVSFPSSSNVKEP